MELKLGSHDLFSWNLKQVLMPVSHDRNVQNQNSISENSISQLLYQREFISYTEGVYQLYSGSLSVIQRGFTRVKYACYQLGNSTERYKLGNSRQIPSY